MGSYRAIGLFSPFIVGVPEIERRSSGLLASAFTH